MARARVLFGLILSLSFAAGTLSQADEPRNHAAGDPGALPVGDDGEPLNFDFESGTLDDWTAEGDAWEKQPVKGEIAEQPNRAFGEGKKSLHTGDWWLGGYERLQDVPTGTLTSAAFEATQPWASFLLGGGSHADTRVELVREDNNQVFFRISGVNQEEMRPVVVNLQSVKGKKIFIRLVDGNTGGWGHVNFDDFRLYAARPRFENQVLEPVNTLTSTEVYPHAGLLADEAAAAMQVPPGFMVQVAAAEPDVAQPIAMAIDDRGRLWVAEAFTYPQRAEPGQGQDRIVIFEDTDLDGTLDKKKVFIEGLNLVSGLEVGFGGVWVGSAPYLAFIPDRNHNDVPDGLEAEAGGQRPEASEGEANPDFPAGTEILLDGWHYEDTHETLNAFNWGPDGWLYGCHGVFTHSLVGKPGTPDDERTPLNAAIWRYHPVRHEFEIFAEGTSNPWGVDFDDWGQCFCTACVIPHLYHIVQGARYQRQAGNHFNEFTFDDVKTIARHRHYVGNQWNDNDRKRSDDLGGGHAHAGAMFYLGGSWPDEYRNKLFMNNIHGNRLNVDEVWHEGSGYVGDRNPDFLLTGDKWSQMLYMTYGPDGQVWVIDWYDANQCHRPEEGAHDKTNGRIFRITFNDAPPVAVDLVGQDDVALAQFVDSPNDWYVRHSRRLLMERAAAGDLSVEARDVLRERLFPQPTAGEPLLAESADPQLDARRLRALWALHVTGDHWLHDDVTMDQLLNDPSPWLRAWSVQLLFEELNGEGLTEDRISKLAEMAAGDPSPVVRLYLASLAGRLAPQQRWSIVEGLIVHAEDAGDHNLPLLYWYAMEPLADENPQRALALAMSAGETIPLLRDYMIRRLGSGEPEKSLQLLVSGLADTKDTPTRVTFLKGIYSALKGNSDTAKPDSWDLTYLKLIPNEGRVSTDTEVRLYASTIDVLWDGAGDGSFVENCVTDRQEPVALRRLALALLLDLRHGSIPELLRELLNDSTMRSDALRAASSIEDKDLAAVIVDGFQTMTPAERRDALGALASRPGYAAILLNAVRDNRIPRDQLSADLVRQLRNLNDPDLTQQIEQVWGVVRDTPEERLKLIAEYRALLESPPSNDPDRELGRAIYAKTCQQCHTLFGTGNKVGPDITGANRASLEYLLTNVLDPSAVMAKEYRPSVIATEDGRVITGIIKEETDSQLTIQTANEVVTLAPDEVAARKESEKSMMPEDQLNPFTEHEVRSLFAYLGGAGQTPLLATPENVSTFFNGQDLTGWIGRTEGREQSAESGGAESSQPLWFVENGMIVGRSSGLDHNEFLVSQLSLGDFRFRCKVKLVDNAGNSGIQIRSVPLSDGEVRGYQCDIGAGWWGKLYEERGRGLLVDNDAEKHVQPGEWNDYEILAVGSRVQTWINGEPCVDYDDAAGARRGVIAVQLHSGGPTEVYFAELELTLLEPNPQDAVIGDYPVSAGGPAEGEITWKKTQLDEKFRGEGVGVADFNNDGRMDISSGSVWFENTVMSNVAWMRARHDEDLAAAVDGREPREIQKTNWTTHSVLEQPEEYNIDGYSKSFMNWGEDLNGDGWLDLIVVDFPGEQTWWFENPHDMTQPWTRHEITPVTNNESPQYTDVDGDGRRELVFGGENGLMTIASPKSFPDAPWAHLPISVPGSPGCERFSHGLGIGDVNGDGRKDVLIPNGWWEQPEDAAEIPWTFHEASFGQPCSHMHVFDFDGDGDNDVLSASPHDFGIWWHERAQSGESSEQSESTWTSHEIDREYSETHAVVLADMNGDGLPDFVTGKRWWSHNGHGPGADGPAVLYWYELQRKDGRPEWTRHEIDADSGVGTMFTVADINADGLLDVITSNKKGTFVFEQQRGR